MSGGAADGAARGGRRRSFFLVELRGGVWGIREGRGGDGEMKGMCDIIYKD